MTFFTHQLYDLTRLNQQGQKHISKRVHINYKCDRKLSLVRFDMLKNTRSLREEAFSGWLLQLFIKMPHQVNLLLIFLEMIKPRRVIGLIGLACYNTVPKVCKMRQPIWKSLWNFLEAKAPPDAAEADFVTALSLSVSICLCLYLSIQQITI